MQFKKKSILDPKKTNVKCFVFDLDCYTRTSIGSKLPDANVVSRAQVESLTECKEECSKNGNNCNAFTYG